MNIQSVNLSNTNVVAALGTTGSTRPNAMILGYPCILEELSNIFPAPVPGVDQEVDELTPPDGTTSNVKNGFLLLFLNSGKLHILMRWECHFARF